jgi:hypothetical protein
MCGDWVAAVESKVSGDVVVQIGAAREQGFELTFH